MSSLLKSTILGMGLLAGVAATAYAQSVSNLPPTNPVTTAPNATAPVYSSTQPVGPNAGANSSWEHHYSPAAGYEADKSQHPYSTSIGPQPGSHSSGQDVRYQASDKDSDPARHPYSTNGFGPKPN
jgi:hypothetical protein